MRTSSAERSDLSRQRVRIGVCAAAALIALAAVWFLLGRWARSNESGLATSNTALDRQPTDGERSATASQARRAGLEDPGDGIGVVFRENFSQLMNYQSGGPKLTISTVERIPDAAQRAYEHSSTDYVASSAIVEVVTRQAHEFYIAGVEADGSSVIERWTIEVPTGGYACTRVLSTMPIGVPVPGWPCLTLELKGGVYVSTDQRQPSVQRRELLWRSSTLPKISCIAVDPDGRFVLFVAGNSPKGLYQLPLADAQQPILLHSATEYPHINGIDCIGVTQMERVGRVYQMASLYGDSRDDTLYTLLHDTDNDGNFNGIVPLTAAEWEAGGYGSLVTHTMSD